jgi:hypothetical protein
MSRTRVFQAAVALELAHLNRNRSFVALTALAALSFLVMVSLFGLTGSYAPVALINGDGGPYAQRFIEALLAAHHSFALKYMGRNEAETALHSERLAGILTIPAGFSAQIERGETVAIDIQIDNVDVDLTNDVQRALPAAIVDFGRRRNRSGGSGRNFRGPAENEARSGSDAHGMQPFDGTGVDYTYQCAASSAAKMAFDSAAEIVAGKLQCGN